MTRWLVIGAFSLLFGWLAIRVWAQNADSVAGPIGGPLRGCPASPNCASTLSGLEPVRIKAPVDQVVSRVKEMMSRQRRTHLESELDGYLHFSVSSLIFGFIDDVEFHMRPGEALLDMRSASRVGYSDLGVNRRRLSRVRRTILELEKESDR